MRVHGASSSCKADLGKEVAVKVQRPGIENHRFGLDILSEIARFVGHTQNMGNFTISAAW